MGNQTKHFYSKYRCSIIIAIVYNASIYLFATNYVSTQNQSLFWALGCHQGSPVSFSDFHYLLYLPIAGDVLSGRSTPTILLYIN